MLFYSFEFMYLFFPVVVAVFFLIGKLRPSDGTSGALWLAVSSLFFYGWWNFIYVPLICASAVFNYVVGLRLRATQSRALLILGLGFNLGLLGYFKYAGFFAGTLNSLTGIDLHVGDVVLPLAISFFTFQKIAWLVDNYTGRVSSKGQGFINYSLFVMFFPQLIAGPIVHHSEIMPQFADEQQRRFNWNNFSVGLAIFIMGLAKKVVIADSAAPIANAVFNAAAQGHSMGFIEAWAGALAYTVQIYFDFSGYTDMAIGLAAMLNIRLPLNFNSPYKATSISDFWRRWHITLSRFLRDYVYIPLGGNRKGKLRQYMNLMATMLIGGLWHGANWTFVFWGGLHGLYLAANHLWTAYSPFRLPTIPARGLTFICVVVAWVFFRATSFDAAWRVIEGMADLRSLFEGAKPHLLGIQNATQAVLPALLVAWFFPNTQEIVHAKFQAIGTYLATPRDGLFDRLLFRRMSLEVNMAWTIYLSVLASSSVWFLLDNSKIKEFIYFQF
jgi:D-alanyl-lipoteichoic acid acyltransferase DltB (MBOAT superfamily)